MNTTSLKQQLASLGRSFTLKLLLALLSGALLGACGGGGAGDSPAAAPAPAPAPAPTPAPLPAASFSIEVPQNKTIVFQGLTAVVQLKVTRSGGFDGAVSVALSGLPEGTSATTALVGAGTTEADITIAAASAAPHSLPTAVSAQGSAQIDGTTRRANASLTLTVRGAAGTVDTSFAGGPQLTRVGPGEDYAHAVTVQADGKVLVAGSSASTQGTHIAVVRYLRDGTVDSSFGTGGRAIAAVGTRDDEARAIAVQADGRIVVAGLTHQRSADYDFALVRFMPDGTPDTSFGDQGRVVTDFGGDSDRAFAIQLMADGRIVAGGQSNVNRTSTGVDFALARYLANGQLDTSFGSGGKVVAAILPGGAGDMVRGLAVQTVDGSTRILAVGGEGDFTAARFTDAGAFDVSFGNGGRVSGLFGVSIGAAYAVTVLPSGEAVIAGHAGHDFAAVRLTVNGQLDARFGPALDGRFRHPMSTTNWDEATTIAHQVDGRLLLGGWVYTGAGTSGDFAVLRLTAEGRLDASFAQGGLMTQAVAGAKTDLGRAIVLQADERLPAVRAIVAGEAQDSNRDFALLRLWL